MEDTSEFTKKIIDLATSSGGKIVLAILVLIFGLLLIKCLTKMVNKRLDKSKMDVTVKNVVSKLVKLLLYLVLLVGLIEILGVPMTSVAALIASAGLAVGLGFQGALSNLAGGFLILIFKPFKVGDYINASDAEGTVRDISIFYTKLLTLDNRTVLVPNGDLMNSNVTNLSAEPVRRIDLDFKITNDIDQNFVRGVLLGAAEKCEGVLEEPAPFTRLTAVDDDTYIFTVRGWCDTAHYWDVYFDLIETCSKALAENGIDDPEERIAIRLVGKEEDEQE
nr:mechanosensitive ion channel family protein [Lachnospiraceae bacterium]